MCETMSKIVCRVSKMLSDSAYFLPYEYGVRNMRSHGRGICWACSIECEYTQMLRNEMGNELNALKETSDINFIKDQPQMEMIRLGASYRGT